MPQALVRFLKVESCRTWSCLSEFVGAVGDLDGLFANDDAVVALAHVATIDKRRSVERLLVNIFAQ